MGLRSAGIACQKATDIVRYICGISGVTVLNYLDDIGGAEVPHHAQDAFRYVGHLLSALGLDESHSKACEPAVRMTFLGILFDTVSMVMEVTPERLQEISNEVEMCLVKQSTSKHELHVLLGKLHFITKCVRQGRICVSAVEPIERYQWWWKSGLIRGGAGRHSMVSYLFAWIQWCVTDTGGLVE